MPSNDDSPGESLREWAADVIRTDGREMVGLMAALLAAGGGITLGAEVLGWRAVEFAVLTLLLADYLRGGRDG